MGTNCSICVSPVSRLLNVKVKVTQSCPTLCDPINYTVHGILQAMGFSREYWSGLSFPFSRGSSQPRSPTLQADSLTTEPQGKPKNIRVGSLSLLQEIFLTQESNWGLLHCRQFLYQLSYNFYFKYEFKLSLEHLNKTGRKKTNKKESLDREDSNKK